jgi:hypothetical protein
MTQKFMCFLHFHRTEDYMQYLHCKTVEQQKASGAKLPVRATEHFALDSREGRKHAICNLLGLVKFWEGRWRQNVEVVKTDIDGGDLEEGGEGDSDVEKTEGSGEGLRRDDDDIDSGEEGEEEDSSVDIDEEGEEEDSLVDIDEEGEEEDFSVDIDEEGEEEDSVDIDDSNDEDYSARPRKRMRRS